MHLTSENLQIMENCSIFREATYRVIAGLKGICNILRERERERDFRLWSSQEFFIIIFFLGINRIHSLYLRNSLY